MRAEPGDPPTPEVKLSDPPSMLAGMSLGEAILGEAFDAMGWPWRRVQRLAAWVMAASMVFFPITFRHALTAYANHEASVWVHEFEQHLPQPPPPPPTQPQPTRR